MRIISRADLESLISMPRAIAAVAQAFAQLSAGTAQVALRQHVAVPPVDGLALLMPAYLGESGALGVKLLSLFPQNAGTNTPVIQAVVLLFDPNDGTPLALMDGTFLTTLRTGAASGIATDLMARKDARVLALFGAGATAFHQVLAVCSVRPIERVWIVNRTADQAKRLVDMLRAAESPIPADVRISSHPEEALSEADIVCLATASPTPLFFDRDIRPGTHINGIGSYLPTMQEIPGATVARARIVVDQRTAAWAEAGDLVIPRAEGLIDESHVVAELGDLVLGRAVGRVGSDEITFFKSVGNAAQDISVAQLALTLAGELKVGNEVDL